MLAFVLLSDAQKLTRSASTVAGKRGRRILPQERRMIRRLSVALEVLLSLPHRLVIEVGQRFRHRFDSCADLLSVFDLP
jgi:hypothetical protein